VQSFDGRTWVPADSRIAFSVSGSFTVADGAVSVILAD